MIMQNIAIKRLTMNDCAFKNPKSKSHQIGFNLPRRAFESMFNDLVTDESERVIAQNFVVKWFDMDNELIVEIMQAIKFYHSKGELRMVDLNHDGLKEIFNVGTLLLFRRFGIDIQVTVYPPNSEEIITNQYGIDLISKIPTRKSS
jgi:hypothetical protein